MQRSHDFAIEAKVPATLTGVIPGASGSFVKGECMYCSCHTIIAMPFLSFDV